MVIDKCLCGAPMKLVTEGRGYDTYGCSKGCGFYQYDETEKKEETHKTDAA